jgi:glycosyltransferase involved in cell wall biosynthesis
MPSDAGAAHPTFSVVIAVYGNEATLPAVVERMGELAGLIPGALEVVFVVDGSPDASLLILRRLLSEPLSFRAQLIALSRNFGAFSAVRAGLAVAEGDFMAVAAADLQEPLSLLRDFYDRLAGDDCDLAIGVRTRRADPPLSRFASGVFWRFYRRFVQRSMPVRGMDVFGCTRRVVTEMLRLNESHTSLVGLLLWVGFRQLEVPYERVERRTGKSSWSLRKRLGYFFDSVYSFTDLPVHMITVIGVVGVVASIMVSIAVFITWAVGAVDVAGYTPLMLAIVFTGSSTLLSLGIIGSYVWRTYENTKARPYAIPMTEERFPAADA